ncbi:MAG: hypothetical protein IKG47_00160 [Oscillospiraceae bacterium]|nr:hypothetical protein [Clostridiales bacterium]MBR3353757.1 hypothetical protein [Oscillospiraceae bacterium]
MASSDKYRDLVRENKAIEFHGLAFKPLTVRQFALYQAAKPAFELMQSSLPPKFARYSWCNCLDAMDRQAKEEGKTTVLLTLALTIVALSLQLESVNDHGKPVYPVQTARDKDGELVAIVIMDHQNPVALNMLDMQVVREIIAAQNVYEIPDERWNPELVRAQKYTASLKQNDIDYNLDDLTFSVALNAGVKPQEIWGWTIRDFILMQDAIDRKLNYQIYTTAMNSGFVKFNRGNPYPTWKFNRRPEMPSEFTTIAELDAGAKGLLSVTEKEV